MAPRPLRQSWPSPSPPPTIAHYNGTLRWHPAMAPHPLHPAMAPWCHVQCAKVVRRPPPLLQVRTPIAIAIWGKKHLWHGSKSCRIFWHQGRYPRKIISYNSLLAIQVGCHKSLYILGYLYTNPWPPLTSNMSPLQPSTLEALGRCLPWKLGWGWPINFGGPPWFLKEPKKKDEQLAIMKSWNLDYWNQNWVKKKNAHRKWKELLWVGDTFANCLSLKVYSCLNLGLFC